MIICGIEIDTAKLISKDDVLEQLRDSGESDCALSDVRGRYNELFGNDLIWRYPISDGTFAGVTIVTVKEGFLQLPYDNMEKTEYELFELDKASLIDEDELERFIDDWKMFSDDLLTALGDMRFIVQARQEAE